MSGYRAKFPTTVHMRWITRAGCKEVDPEIFFPDRNNRRDTQLAVSICRSCPVISECMEHALHIQKNSHFDLEGIWGGLSKGDRKAILQRQSKEHD